MKKIIILIFVYLFLVIFNINSKASTDDYNTFSEIMMNEGKLMCNYTDEEIKEMLQYVQKRKFAGVNVYEKYKGIDASYISNTLYSVENSGATDVIYEVEVEVETNNKTTFKASGSLNGSLSGKNKEGTKGDIAGECGIEYSNTSETSRKETQKMELIVEGNSRAIVYLTGNLTVTNGVAAYYVSWFRVSEGGFEIVTIKNQYARVEKSSI